MPHDPEIDLKRAGFKVALRSDELLAATMTLLRAHDELFRAVHSAFQAEVAVQIALERKFGMGIAEILKIERAEREEKGGK